MAMYKPFSKELYDKFDRIAHQTIKDNVLIFDVSSYHETEDYNIDCTISLGNKTFFLELEVLQSWKNEVFPFKTIHHLHRKVMKYKDLKNSFYLQFNKTLSHVGISRFSEIYILSNLNPYSEYFNNPLTFTNFIPVNRIEDYFMKLL